MMSTQPTVGLAIIARNEENTLPRLLASIEGAFDQVVLLDTGSTDNTVQRFTDWAEHEQGRTNLNQGGVFTWKVDTFTWCHDFAAARQHAEQLLTTDWHAWADCDDLLTGAQNLRGLAANASPELAAFVFDYAYAHDQHGNVTTTLKRERLVRAGAGRWAGRIHEAQLLDGPAVFVAKDTCEWVHRPVVEGRDPDRNLRILRRWLKDEPHNTRVLAYMGTEELARGQLKKALAYFRRYLAEAPGWDEERAQVHRKISQALIANGDLEKAEQAAYQAMRVMPSWPDSYLTLAEIAYHRQEWRNAGDWGRRVLELGVPDTLLIINPLDYTLSPRIIIAGSMGGLGQVQPAIQLAEEILQIVPDHTEVLRTLSQWRAQFEREQAAQRAISDAQVLVAHDEQAKALLLLEQCVPYFATDHPSVVAARSQLRQRLRFLADPAAYAEHYVTGGSKSEDFLDDETALKVAGVLPRCSFLFDGLRAQAVGT